MNKGIKDRNGYRPCVV